MASTSVLRRAQCAPPTAQEEVQTCTALVPSGFPYGFWEVIKDE